MRNVLNLTLLLLCMWACAQQDATGDIVIFVSGGVTQETQILNGRSVNRTLISSQRLAQNLTRLGIRADELTQLRPSFDLTDTLKRQPNGGLIRKPNMQKLYRLSVKRGVDRKELIKQLSQLPEVLFVEASVRAVPYAVPSDIRYDGQWGLKNDTNLGKDIHAEGAWNIYTGNPNNIIAIIDGGINKSHEDLDDKVDGGSNGFGWSGHGIQVAGIAAAESNNMQGIAGVDWHAKIHNRRVDNLSDDADFYDAIVDAVDYSPNVKVLNHSWGLDPGENSTVVRMAFAYAYKANRVSVAAMGNYQDSHPNVTNYPAGFSNVIAVGSSNQDDEFSTTSSQGNHIDLLAPGEDILSTLTNNGYEDNSGNSFSAPFVSGVASLLIGYAPYLDNDDVENLIVLSADTLEEMNGASFTPEHGHGRLNAEEALKLLQAPNELKQWTASGGSVHSTSGIYQQTFFGAGNLADANYLVKRKEVRKAIIFPEEFCEVISAWGRGVDAIGWRDEAPNYGEGFTDVIPGTVTTSGAILRTYVYEVWSLSQQSLGHYPASPSNAVFAYSVLGVPEPNAATTGPSLACYSDQEDYSLTGVPVGTSIAWSKSSNLVITGGQNTSTVTVTPSSPFVSGLAWVEAELMTDECGTFEIEEYEFWVGRPSSVPEMSYNLMYDFPDEICVSSASATGDFFAGYVPYMADNAEWETDAGSILTDPTPSGYSSVTVRLNNYGTSRFIRVRNMNECGSSNWLTHYFDLVYDPNGCEGGGGGIGGFAISPNPSTNMVTVSDQSDQSSKEMISIEVLSDRQKLVMTRKSRDSSFQMDISGLESGTYYFRVTRNGQRKGVIRVIKD